MKRLVSTGVLILAFALSSFSQQSTFKSKADSLAKNDFSKSKEKRIEKYGVVREVKKTIISTPVATNDLSFYLVKYVNEYLKYKIEIRKDALSRPIATLSIGGKPAAALENTTIDDAYFTARTPGGKTGGSWEGVFVDKNDNGIVEFGLGLILPDPVSVDGLRITKIFLKKLSP